MEEKLERESGFLWSNVEEGKWLAKDFISGGNPELPPLIGKTKYVVNTTKKFRGRIGVHEGVNNKNGKIIVEVLPWQQLREFNAEDLMKNPDESEQQRARDLEKRCGPRKRKSRCEIPKVKWPKRNPKKKKVHVSYAGSDAGQGGKKEARPVAESQQSEDRSGEAAEESSGNTQIDDNRKSIFCSSSKKVGRSDTRAAQHGTMSWS